MAKPASAAPMRDYAEEGFMAGAQRAARNCDEAAAEYRKRGDRSGEAVCIWLANQIRRDAIEAVLDFRIGLTEANGQK